MFEIQMQFSSVYLTSSSEYYFVLANQFLLMTLVNIVFFAV